MLAQENLIAGFEDALGAQKSMPFIRAFTIVGEMFTEQKRSIDEFKIVIKDYEEHKTEHKDLKVDIKKDLLVELATKADIEKINGKIETLEKELSGKIETSEQRLNGKIEKLDGKIEATEQRLNGKIGTLYGELKKNRLWMQLIVGLMILFITMFSPNALQVLKLFKV